MKKVTTGVLALFCIIFSTVSAQKAERKPFNKKVAAEYVEQDGQHQVYLDRTDKFVLTTVKSDTVRSAKDGRLIREITTTTTTATIRKNEEGVIVEWVGDDMVWVTFDTEERQGLKLPFITSASGKGNTSNNMVLMTDSVCGHQINGDAIPCKPSARVVTLGSEDDEDIATYTFEGQKPKLVYEIIFKKIKKAKKVKSTGQKVAK